MSKHIARTITLALTLLALAPAALANQTGGDPEPMPPELFMLAAASAPPYIFEAAAWFSRARWVSSVWSLI